MCPAGTVVGGRRGAFIVGSRAASQVSAQKLPLGVTQSIGPVVRPAAVGGGRPS